MPVQQRYTPVPGMGPSAYTNDMLQAGPSGVTMGSGSGYSDRNPFDTPNSAPYSSPFNPSSSSGVLPASSREPQDDSFPQYDPTRPAYPSHRSSGSFAGAAGAGAGAGGVAAGSGNAMRNSATSNTLAYQSVPSEQYWPNSSPAGGVAGSASKANRNKWLKWGLGTFAVLAVIGIVVGVAVSQVNKNKKSPSNGSSNDNSGSNSGGTTSSGSDPSQFTKDSRLHQSFWAFAYTPEGTQPPWCAGSQANVTRDIQILSQLTTRLRLYGANCNTTDLVLSAIDETKVNMTIWPAIYVDSNETAYENQLQAITEALQKHGTDHIEGIIVGNEYILNTAGSDSNTSATYLAAENTITTKVAEVKTTLQGLNLDKTLPVGTSDAGSLMSTTLGAGIDFFMANVHPYFGQQPIDEAATWTTGFFHDFDVSVAEISTGQPETYIAETGWPSQSMNASDASDGAGSPQGDASIANLQTFLDTFVCQANANGTKYFYFEAFDEPWKAPIYGGVEPFWGLMNANRTLKDLTIPQC